MGAGSTHGGERLRRSLFQESSDAALVLRHDEERALYRESSLAVLDGKQTNSDESRFLRRKAELQR